MPAVGVELFSAATYLTGDPTLSRIPLDPAIFLHYLTIVLHALPASLVLLIGVPVRGEIARQAAVAAIAAAMFSVDGISAQIALYLPSVAWLYTLLHPAGAGPSG